jgi:3-oxoacyl-[acyl-carrier protein] reductase
MGVLLKDKVAIVTGGGRGIGERISLLFAENGALVIVADIDMANAESVAGRIRDTGGKAAAVRLDVGKVQDIREKVQHVDREFGRIDILVNNAGIAQDKAIEEITEQDWDTLLDVDLKGVFFCSQAVYTLMKARRSGKIINIASLAGVRGGRFAGAHYSAAKGGIIVLTKCFALAGGSYNVNVNAIAPGLIATKMAEELGWIGQEHKDIPLGRLGCTEDVANAALFLASDMSAYITGETINLNGGMHMS